MLWTGIAFAKHPTRRVQIIQVFVNSHERKRQFTFTIFDVVSAETNRVRLF